MTRRARTSLEARTVALLRQAARGRSRRETLARKAALLLADRALRATEPVAPPAEYFNPRPGWWPDSGFTAQDRPDWSQR